MAEKQVIRQDIVQIAWDVQPSPLNKINAQTDYFHKKIAALNKDQTKLKGFQKEFRQLNAQKLTNLSKSIDNVTKKIGTGMVGAVKTASKALATLGIAAGGAAASGAVLGVKYNAQMEKYQTSFEVMTGSASKATEVVNKLQKMGASTPFEMTDLAETTQLLMNYGLTADNSIKQMSMLGDIAQGDADKMNRIAMAYGQMSSAGKVSLEDVKQMIEAGFNPLQEISTTTGESMSSLYERISKGKISVDEITSSMERSTSKGGKYFQSMQKQSQTFDGQLSTMKDNFNQMLGNMTKGLTEKLAGTVLPKINSAMGEISDAFTKGGFSAAFDTLTQKLGPIGTALQNVVNKVKAFVSNNEKMQIIKDTFGKIKTTIGNVVSIMGTLASKVWDFVTSTKALNFVKSVFSGISKAVQWVKDHLEGVIQVVGAFGAAFLITGAAVKIVSTALTVYNGIMKAVKTIQLIAKASQLGFNAAMLACPITWIVGAIVALIAIIILLVKNWDKVKAAALKCWNKIKEVFGPAAKWINTTFIQPVVKFFKGLWNVIKFVVEFFWEIIKAVWGKISGWVKKNVIDPVMDKFKPLWDDFSEKVKKVKEAITNAFSDAWDKVTDTWSGIKDFFKGIWEDAVKAVAKPVNKIIDGANWVMEKIGSDKRWEHWEPYAKGTNGHPGGNAIVNDGRGAELVQMPNGNTFIPKGRNVGIPNAPKGMKVLNAERTAQLMGRSTPTFNYAGGIGDWAIWDFFDNAKGLVQKVIDKFISWKDMGGYALDVGKAIVSKATGAMADWVKGLFKEHGGKSLADYNPSAGVEQWRSTVAQALSMEGLNTAANIKRTLYQMQTESGGNPKAINNWDSNAKKGTPSKGLMQVIDPTFKAYARKGYASNIYDPLSNILASVRYATSRYGSLEKAYQGHGYAEGVGTIALPAYTPATTVAGSHSATHNNNNYSPSFTLNMSGTVDRTTERTIKKWVQEALEEMFESMERANPRLTEV